MAGEFTGKVIADKYRVETRIGSSGLGELYRGTNTLIEKDVSLVVLPPEIAVDPTIKSRFFAETKTAAKISHPNVLNLTDFGTDPTGIVFAVYESSKGETLREALEREGKLPVEMAVNIAQQTAAALSAAHAGGLIHGNLSTGKILVAGGEPGSVSVKVFDFGTPNAINDDRSDAEPDPSRFAYLAPEQCAGSDMADERGDIYSLGAILFEMLAGSQPFTGTTPTDVMMRQIEEPPPPISAFRHDLPPATETVVLKALAKNPEMRYQTATEFADELSGVDSAPAAIVAAAIGGNNAWKTAFVVFAGIALLTAALIYATSVKQTDPTTAMQPDVNGMPVQPINPATGAEEQNLSMMPGISDVMANSNMALSLDTMPGGDGYNAWGNGGVPPPGAPGYVPGGQVVTVPSGQSPFMTDPNCVLQPSGILLCPVPVTPTPKPSATPKATPAANVATTPVPNATPRATPTPAKPVATPAKTPEKPAANTP